MKRNQKLALLLFLVLLIIPAGLVIFMATFSKNEYKELPILGPKKLSADKDTIYHQLNNFELNTSSGQTLDTSFLNSKVTLIHVFCTRCDSVYQNMIQISKGVQKQLVDLPSFQILSISGNPEYDNRELLITYADSLELNLSNWYFSTGTKDEILDFCQNQLLLSVQDVPQKDNPVTLSDRFIMVGPKRRIRAMHKSDQFRLIKELREEAVVLSVVHEL